MKGQNVHDLLIGSPFVRERDRINFLIKYFDVNAEVDLDHQEDLILQIIFLNQEMQLWVPWAINRFDPEAIQRVKDAATRLESDEQYNAQNSEK